MSKLPKQYNYLLKETGPNMLLQALALYGIEEIKGPASNPIILAWAEEVGLNNAYKHDSVAWCGLGMAIAAKRAGWEYNPGSNALWARNWAQWGDPSPQPMLGDIMVFARGRGGHVALYVGEDKTHWHILGANQSDAYNIVRKEKRTKSDGRLITARRAPWRIAEPANVRRIELNASGPVSVKEN